MNSSICNFSLVLGNPRYEAKIYNVWFMWLPLLKIVFYIKTVWKLPVTNSGLVIRYLPMSRAVLFIIFIAHEITRLWASVWRPKNEYEIHILSFHIILLIWTMIFLYKAILYMYHSISNNIITNKYISNRCNVSNYEWKTPILFNINVQSCA